MQVNSIGNINTPIFGNEVKAKNDEKGNLSEKEVSVPKQEIAEDKFETSTLQPQKVDLPFAMPSIEQITKMQTTQKVMGGSLFAIGVLGALSFLSPKKWLTALFTVPVGGIMAYFGANMFNSAGALDKLKAIANTPKE